MRLAVLIAAVLLVLAGVVLLPKSGGPGLSSLGFTRIGALRMDEANAEQQVIAIVNQAGHPLAADGKCLRLFARLVS